MKAIQTLLPVLLLVVPAVLPAAESSPAPKPNVIVILTDDMGWTDLGCFGSKFYQTPNIDRLCGQGMRFTDAYSACTVCSPSRASILTGQYPARMHITDWIAGHVRPKAKLRVPDWTMHLPLETMNIAKALKPAGYASASIGKWHLGDKEFWPDQQGFDLNVAIVIFTSDNGGLIGNTINLGLRAGKGSAYEGGVRVPLVVKWPGVTKPGSVCQTPVIGTDLYPTLLVMTGIPRPDGIVDGESIAPLLRQSGPLQREAIYWHYPHYHPGGATPYSAIRQGDFRLVEFHEDQHVELYNLKQDLGETHDLADKLPAITAALRQKLHAWRQQAGAQMPTPNPAYDSKPKAETSGEKAQRLAESASVMEQS